MHDRLVTRSGDGYVSALRLRGTTLLVLVPFLVLVAAELLAAQALVHSLLARVAE